MRIAQKQSNRSLTDDRPATMLRENFRRSGRSSPRHDLNACWAMGYFSVIVHGLLGVCCLLLVIEPSQGQGPGMGGGNAPSAPNFEEPSFRDKMWASGGPRLNGISGNRLVTQIEIQGNETLSQHKILSYMQTRPDRVFDENQLLADIRELYRTDLFRKISYDIQDTPQGVVIKLRVMEQATVSEVIFHGNTRIDDRMLKKHCAIEIGDPCNPFSVDMARQRLVDLYLQNGFNHVAIEVREGNRPGDRRVYFEIAEGPLERIWSINFAGNQDFSSALLKTKIKSKDARGGITAWAFNKANMIQIEDDKELLVAYYRSLGYFKARVDYRIDYYDDGDFLDVTFVIDEGPRFRVRNVSITGNQFFRTDMLLEALELKPGDYFNSGQMYKDQQTLRNEFYGREGFVYVDIETRPTFLRDQADAMDLVYEINEGDQYVAGEINVHIDGDSSHTKHNVVLNLLGIRPGELIDLQKLENSERRLKATQIFETNPAIGDPPRIEVQPPDAMDSGF